MLSRTFSFRSVWVVPYVALIVLTVGLVGLLSLRNGQKAVNDLAEQLLDRTNQLVTQHLDSYLTAPKNLVKMNAIALENGTLDAQALTKMGDYFWQQARTYQVTWINYGLENGDYIGAGYFEDKWWISETSSATDMVLYNYVTDEQGVRIEGEADPSYEHRSEAWYLDTIDAGKLTWSDIYVWDGIHDLLSVGIGQPIYRGHDQPIGVIGVDLSLAAINDFLRTLQITPSTRVLIVEQDGMIVGSSAADAPFIQVNDQAQRLNIKESADPVIKAAAEQILKQNGGFAHIQEDTSLPFLWGQEWQFLCVTPWHDELGLMWWVVVIVSESDFMAQINAGTQQTIILSSLALIVALIIGMFASRLISRPAAALKSAAQNIAAGQLTERVIPSKIRELDEVGNSFNAMAVQLQDSFVQLEYAATHDSLTGLPNRASFRRVLTESITRHNLHRQSPSASDGSDLFAVLFLDLDYFKLLNDSLGHLAGDQVLIEVAQRLNACIDTRGVVARFGGDEFVILVDPISKQNDIDPLVEMILEQIRSPFILKEKTAFISTSIGVAFSTTHVTNADDLLRNADIALYRAKSKGKAVHDVFDDEMYVEVVERLTLETDLRNALTSNQLAIHYQPIVFSQTLEPVGVEALMRWQHPTLGMIPPGKFIPIAEETGLIIPLGWWVLRNSCLQLRRWQEQFPNHPLVVSVNLSSRQFIHPDLLSQVQQILLETGLPPHALKLEITESLLISDRIAMQTRMTSLKQLGIKLSLDDFGTGYSSLSYLHRFPLDTLKIDHSFIQQMLSDKQSSAIVESIVTMAHKLGMDVIAEGVETQDALDYLRDFVHCEYIQGFLISQALPAEGITRLIQQQQWAIPVSTYVPNYEPLPKHKHARKPSRQIQEPILEMR